MGSVRWHDREKRQRSKQKEGAGRQFCLRCGEFFVVVSRQNQSLLLG